MNPETDSKIEIEEDGDFTVTFSMILPQQPSAEDEEQS